MSAENTGIVQVLDIRGGVLHSMSTYRDDREGNKKAEAKFRECVKVQKPYLSDEDIEEALCDGYAQTFGNSVCITHASIEKEEE